MSGTITALKAQERSKDRVSVYLDGEFAFGLALIHALWLKIGQRLSDDEITELHEADTLEKAKVRALGLISYRPRSVQEVRQRLSRAGVDDAAIAGVITDLQSAGLLDDTAFSNSWVESRLDTSPRSKKMIAWELRRKGVNEATIHTSLQSVNDDSAAYQLALKRLPRLVKLATARERRQKLTEHLARHGFSYDIIRDVMSKLEQEMNTALESAEEPEDIVEPIDAAE
jgi:regulatory protein